MGVGKVYIVGAGPGSADLITVRGLRILRQAEVLICDSLLPQSFVQDLGIPTAGKIVKWLTKGRTRTNQAEINRLMSKAAADGKVVARLKGGDPFVFGRTEEEVAFLSAQGIPWEVIPGPSSCTAALSAAALPPTWRREGRSFAVVTARCDGGAVNESYPRADSLVILMGVAVIEKVADRLLRDGWGPDTPAAVLERATLPWEQRVEGALSEIAAIARKGGIAPPAILVVGTAASRRDAFSERPRILFTGLDPSNFRILGDVLHWPALQAVPHRPGYGALPGAIARLKRREFNRVIFTSKVGVRLFFEALEDQRLDARLLGRTCITAAGPGTSLLLSGYGIRADAVAEEPGTGGILLANGALRGERILLVQGSHAPQELQSELIRRGCSVLRLALHRVVPHPALGRPLPAHDIIYFTSASGVLSYWHAYGEDAFRQAVWCIGQRTLARISELGIKAEVVDPNVSVDENAEVSAL